MEQSSKSFKISITVMSAVALLGIAAWVYQFMGGLGVTGMNNGSSWGLYIIMFMFFVGLSAGGLIVASSASIFKIKEFKAVALPAVILSIVCIGLAGAFILVDLGNITNVWRMLTSPNPSAPLVWDMCVITIYLVINFLYLYFMTSKKADPKKVEIISRFALPVAILVHSVTAWIFGLQIAKEVWHSAIMAPLFVASAMDSGLALLLVVLLAMKKFKIMDIDKSLIATLAGLLAVCIAVDAYMIGAEILTMAYPGAAGAHHLAILATGSMAPFFWFEIIAGLAVPFLILVFAKNRQKSGLVVIASILVVLGVLCKRIWLLLSAFIDPNIAGAPGIISGSSAAASATGTQVWAMQGTYAPTMIELAVTAGVIAAGVVVFMLMTKKIVKATK